MCRLVLLLNSEGIVIFQRDGTSYKNHFVDFRSLVLAGVMEEKNREDMNLSPSGKLICFHSHALVTYLSASHFYKNNCWRYADELNVTDRIPHGRYIKRKGRSVTVRTLVLHGQLANRHLVVELI